MKTREEQCVMDNQEARSGADKNMEQKDKTLEKSEADRDKFEKLLEETGRVYGKALRRLAKGEPSTHQGMERE